MLDTAKPDPVDVHVGRRLRSLRLQKGFSQQQLARSVGVTFQQVQKYENGANRISASRLHQFARELGVPVALFFDGLEGVAGTGEQVIDSEPRRLVYELVRAFERLSTEQERRAIVNLVRAMGRAGDSTEH
jgi:transcriptional regulator with XRE-family HTH domain